jgi:pyrimidine-specific ribonucleoside hydrolase
MNLLVETDIGHDPDDFFALCYLFSAGVNIKGILISPGDEMQIAIVDFLLQILGKKDVLIGVPLLGRRKEHPTNIHKAMLDQYKFPYYSSNAILANEVIRRVLVDDDVDFFGCGPLQNLGHYNLPVQLNCATMQGGFIGYMTHGITVKMLDKFKGKQTVPTFNLNGDKKGAFNFLKMDIKERHFVGKNVCHYMMYNLDTHKYITSVPPKDRAAELFREGMTWRFKLGSDGKKFHDPTAAVCHLHPEIGTWVRAKPYSEKGEWGSRLDENGDYVLVAINEQKVWDYLAKGV